MKICLFICAMFIMVACVNSDYRDASLTPEQRTEALLKQMTVEEKVGQLLCPLGWPMYEKDEHGKVSISERYQEFIGVQHGGMLWATFRADPWTRKTLETGLSPRLAARVYNELQRYAIEHSRLGIPVILAEECPHGHMAIGTTVFPTGIGIAATWDTQTAELVGRTVARELRAQGGHIGYGPVIDLAREPRWSRVEETFGEDVCLTSQMAAALVQGMSLKYNGTHEGIVSTLKHFVAYGIPEGGHNGNPSFIGERDLRENFLPPFRAALDAGALSVMTSYNAIDGIPSTANTHLLRDLLRTEWGFEGIVVSDLESIDGLASSHCIAHDKSHAGELAFAAGVDVDLGANCFPSLVKAVRLGRIDEQLLNEAAGRVLRLKFELGLFDDPYVDEWRTDSLVHTPEHTALARQAARQSIVLLKNNGVLPLNKHATVAVIGPNADNMYNQLGDYTAPQERSNIKTVLDGIRAVVGGVQVRYAQGCAIRDMQQSDIVAAVHAAQTADISVVVIGGSSARDFNTHYLDTGAAIVVREKVSDMECGEGFDRASLTLLGHQQELLEAVRAVGKPMVVVYIEGRPLDKRWASEHADALLTLWYPGQEGGTALADVLFGDYNPAGRLPITIPCEVGQLPVYYNKKFPEDHDYVEVSRQPLYEFGYGLSYTRFEYDNLQIAINDWNVEVSFDVHNVGNRDGEEVVQLYVTDREATVVRPRKQLRDFRRVAISAGTCEHIRFTLRADDFALYDREMRWVTESGEFCIAVGASSEDIRLEQTMNDMLNAYKYIFILAAILLLAGLHCCGNMRSGLSQCVDTRIGTSGHGHVFVGANVPHGMVQLGPHMPYRGWDWCSGYHHSDSVLLGFSHTRLSGTGIGDLGDILLMPCAPGQMLLDTTGRPYALFNHGQENAYPGYYRLKLPDCGITTVIGGSYDRYRLGQCRRCSVRRLDARHIVGSRHSTGWAKSQYCFFAAEFSQPFSDAIPVDSCGTGVMRTLTFDLGPERLLEVKVALSPVSEEQALRNLKAELPGWDFEATVAAATAAWDTELGRIEIEPMDDRQRTIFYTALYHTMIAPSLFCDIDGSYRGADGEVHRSDVLTYTTLSLWDTYRAAMPLTTLIDPELSHNLAATMLDIYHEQGKLPVWHLWGNETNCMVGNPGVIVLADLLLKGFVPEARRAEAVEAMRISSLCDERGLELLKQWGYIPFDQSFELETVAKGLEFAIADGALAKAAATSGDMRTAEEFSVRSRSYARYFDPQTQFMRGRASDGSFRTPFDPFRAPHMQSDYTEGNAWQYTWLVPHDVEGLIHLFGGEESFLKKFEEFFVAEGDLGDTADDVTGLIGQYAHGNEPSHHDAYLFNYLGRQDRCAELVRLILDTLYTDAPDGICGNEDVGQMSAWYVLSSLGLYQVDPAGGSFLLGSPVVRSATLHVGEERTFHIVAHGNSPSNRYIQRVMLNGEPLTRSYITYAEITRGGRLELWMGSESSGFGSAVTDRPQRF